MDRKTWTGWAAVLLGVCAMVAAFAVSSTQVGQGFAFGFGAFIAFFGALSVLAHNRAPDHRGLLVVGVAMVVVPFVGDELGWTAWVAGAVAAALGVVGYVRDERSDFAATVRRDAAERYRSEYR